MATEMASAVRTASDQGGGKAPLLQTASPLLLTKLRPPTARRQWVVRERLLERLRAEPGVRLTALVAPAGSGKTTLLSTWLEIEAARRPVGWVSLDERDNDPLVLWSHVFESLRQACPGLETCRSPDRVGTTRIIDTFLPDLVNWLTEQDDAALVLDDFHRLSGPSRDSVAWLVEHAPPSFQLVISTRTEPALPLAALRAHGELLEVRAQELGFNSAEADVFLNDRLELGLEREEVDELVKRTEGWPAGLYLAALSLRGAEDRRALVNRFGGTSRHVVDFLVDEVLEAHDPGMQNLMLRCSVLERLSGPLCDAVLEQAGSSEQLRELARTNLFLLPLDDDGIWYRFHHLFSRLLRVELERRENGLAATLHTRAHTWYRDHGSTDEAIEHAIGAGSYAAAGDLISATWLRYVNAGRGASVLGWLDRFPARVLESTAALMQVKAWVLSMLARRDDALETRAALERMDGSDEAFMATLRACFQWGDVRSGYENSVLATELQPQQDPFWAAACWSRGMGHFYRGEFVEADPWFAEAAGLAPKVEMWVIAASALAYQSLIAGEQRDLDQQRQFAEQAMQLARERRLEESAGEIAVALGESLAARGEFEEARRLCEKGVAMLRAHGQPLTFAYALIRQVPVLRALGESKAAETAFAEARATVGSCSDPGMLEDRLAALERPPRRRSANGNGELSHRELTVLRALTGPLSERDIARELYLSHNTVHFHTKSLYRKLGVSSRSEAIRRARELSVL